MVQALMCGETLFVIVLRCRYNSVGFEEFINNSIYSTLSCINGFINDVVQNENDSFSISDKYV